MCPPPEKRRAIRDVQPLFGLAILPGRTVARSLQLMEDESIFTDVQRWGGNAILLELYQLLLSDQWRPELAQSADIYDCLGRLYNTLGKKSEALTCYEQALSTWREVGDRRGEGVTLSSLGLVYDALGQREEALDYYRRALSIGREVGGRYGEGVTLWNIGVCFFEQVRYAAALACFLLARSIFEEVQSPDRDGVQGWIDDLRRKVGKRKFAALLAEVEPRALQIMEETLEEGL